MVEPALPDAPPPGRAHALLRWWPTAAAILGVVGMTFADNLTTFVLAGLLVLGGLALELAGWAEGVLVHGRRLRRAALVGALAGAAILGLLELRRPPAADTGEGRIALR